MFNAICVDDDMKAYETLFRRYYEPLFYYANKYVRLREEAEDVVQGVFSRLWEKRKSFKVDSVEVQPYLYTSVKNACFNFLKVRKRTTEVSETYLDTAVAKTATPDEEFDRNRMMARIHQALDALPAKRRAIFVMSRFEDKSYKQISEETGLSIKTVENHIGRALKELRETLGEFAKLAMLMIFFNFFP